jgi:hypothetical protein
MSDATGTHTEADTTEAVGTETAPPSEATGTETAQPTEATGTDATAPATESADATATGTDVTPAGADARGPAPDADAPAGGGRGGLRGWLGRHRWLVPTVVVGAAIALPLRGVMRAPGAPMEEGFMLVFPERLLHGDIPNKDFLHLYGPGSIWVIAGFFKVFGISLWTERLVGAIQLVGIISATTYVGYRWGRYAAVLCGVVTAVILIPPIGVTALAWVGGVALAVWSVALAARALDDGHRRPRTLLIAGLLGGFALLYRPDLVICLGLALGVLFVWALDGAGRRRLGLGLAIGLSPYLVHLALAGPGNSITGMVTQPVFELRPGRRLPFPPPSDDYTSFLNRAFAFRDFPWPLPAFRQPMQIAVWFWVLVAVSVVMVAIAVWSKRAGSPNGWRLVALALLAVGLLPQAVQRADTAHLSWVSCVPFGLLPAYLAEAARLRGVRPAAGRAVMLAPLALMLLFPHYTYRWYADYSAQSFGHDREVFSVDHRGRSFYYGRSDVAVAAERMLDDVERLTVPGDRVIVGPGDLAVTPYSEAYLYFMLPQLVPGTRYIEMDPGVANADDSGLAGEVGRADVVILSTMYDNWVEPNTSMKRGSEAPGEVLRRDFCLYGRYGDNPPAGPGQPIFELYTRCDTGEDG